MLAVLMLKRASVGFQRRRPATRLMRSINSAARAVSVAMRLDRVVDADSAPN